VDVSPWTASNVSGLHTSFARRQYVVVEAIADIQKRTGIKLSDIDDEIFGPVLSPRRVETHADAVGTYYFGGWKDSLFGDTHMYGPDSIRFSTRGKVVTIRWPDPWTSRIDLGFPQVH